MSISNRLFCCSILFCKLLSNCTASSAETLSGAGSSAAAPIYRAWAAAYGKKQNFELTYEAAGSSAGLRKIRTNEVDFGASDIAPSASELARDRLVLVPTFVTGLTPVVNLPKLANVRLKLNGEVLAGIFQGAVTRWNAPEIQQLNAAVPLPDLPIKPVVRSDGSGTTFYFTSYLSTVSEDWRQKVGAGSSVKWPQGAVPAKGSDGVARAVKEQVGAIGYIDFNYVAAHALAPVQLKNSLGEFVVPGAASFRAALQVSDWSHKGDFLAPLVNLPGSNVWPITMGTFILLPKAAERTEQVSIALRFFTWSLLSGDQAVEAGNFVRLPDKLQALAFKALAGVTDARGKALGLEALGEVTRR